jgi:hypothetical protein
MDDVTRQSLLQLLGESMSDVSEDCYCAGWLGGTEYFVPELCYRAVRTGQTQPWGHGQVTPDQARGLMALADQIGSWADMDAAGVGYVPFQPFPLPQQYLDELDRELAHRRTD